MESITPDVGNQAWFRDIAKVTDNQDRELIVRRLPELPTLKRVSIFVAGNR